MSPNGISLITENLISPQIKKEKVLLQKIRKLSMDDIEEAFSYLTKNKTIECISPTVDNQKRRETRSAAYAKALYQTVAPYLSDARIVCDVGCGDGRITVAVFKDVLKRKGKLFACDVVNYLSPEVKDFITLKKGLGIHYLKTVSDNFFDATMEVVALHHLSSLSLYKRYIQEMIRVTKVNGTIIFVETVHTTWREHLTNAILDILLNDRTSRQITKSTKRAIPVPVQFLSEKELEEEIQKNHAIIKEKISMRPSAADPKKHCIYICQKTS